MHIFAACRRTLPLLLVLALVAEGVGFLALPAPTAYAAETLFPTERRSRFGGIDWTESLAFGDMNADGHLDLIAASWPHNAVYLNDGHGDYTTAENRCELTARVRCFGAFRNGDTSVAVGDLDGDGDLDIASMISPVPPTNDAIVTLRVGIFLNQEGSFPAAPDQTLDWGQQIGLPLGVPTGDRRLALGDLNGDARLDIVAGGTTSSAIYLASAAGFPAVPSALLAPARAVALGDLDGDGWLDIIAGNDDAITPDAGSTRAISIYLNKQAGAFPAATTLEQAPATGLALGDLDGDGWPDLVTVSPLGPNTVYLNDGAGGFLAGTPFGSPLGRFRSVALGDLNGDGQLDIAVGAGFGSDAGSQNVVYMNRGGGVFDSGPVVCGTAESTSCFGIGFDVTTAIALGDVNGDGALDIAAGNDGGNDGEQSAVYLSGGGGVFASAALPFGPPDAQMRRVALGDLDGDGDLDLVIADEEGDNRWIRNDGTGSFSGAPIPLEPQPQHSYAVALGDLDGDGDLDVVLGNDVQPSQVFLNDGAGGFPAGGLPLPHNGLTLSLAVGDLDGDGDLDIVAGNDGSPSKILLNDGAGGFPTWHDLDSKTDPAQDVALGDLDGDGDLDLVTARNYRANYFYLNDGSGGFTEAGAIGARSAAVALGDLDGDGDLDAVFGSYLSSIFFNDGTGRFPLERPLSEGGRVALGDMDNDDDLDIISYSPTRSAVYLNDGAGGFASSSARSFAQLGDEILHIARGDVDNDGDLDTVAGIRQYAILAGQRSTVYLNGHQGAAPLPNNPPSVRVRRPGPTAEASFYSTPAIVGAPVIPISYTLADPEGDRVRAVRAEYSLDGGGTWRPAAPSGDTAVADLAAPPEGAAYTFGWDTFASGFFGQSDNVVVRIVALPGFAPRRNQTPDAAQRPYAAASSTPFRARGTQVRVVDPAGNGLAGALVLHRPAGGTGPGALVARPDGAPYTTDAGGFLAGRGSLAISDTLVALAPVLPAATDPYSDSYTLYQTNLIPTTQGVEGFRVGGPGIQQITVSPSRPLALFHLDVALEWDARYDQRFMAQLEYDLRRASEFLFDATNGQAALGDINIWHDKENWDTAHVRVYASNRLRPNAMIGGVAGDAFTRTVALDSGERTLYYGPGQVRMGAVWSRFGDQSGSSLSEDWPRTLAHEFGHYLLFLDDNYLGFDAAGQVVPFDGCPGLMADPYASLELRPTADWLPACAGTLSHTTYGRSDWATLTSFYPGLLAPTTTFSATLPGPASLPLDVTAIVSNDPLTPTERLSAPLFSTVGPDGGRYLPGPRANAFLFQDGPDADGEPDRITNLGRASLDQLLARGARSGDRLCLFEPAVQRLGCTTIRPDDEKLTVGLRSEWRPDLRVTPVNTRTLAIELRTLGADGVPAALPGVNSAEARLYPSDDLPTGPPATLSAVPGAPGVFRGTISMSEPLVDGYLHVQARPASGLELVSGFALSGDLGAAVRPAEGRLRSGVGRLRSGVGRLRSGVGRLRSGVGRLRSGIAPVSSAEGDVLLVGEEVRFEAGQILLLEAVNTLPAPPSWATPLGQGYRLTTTASAPDLSSASLSFAYQGAEVPAGEEEGVRVYFYAPAAGAWETLPTALDTYHNIASAPSRGPGIYVLMSSLVAAPLAPGWNLFPYPGARRPVAEALAAINGRYTTVYGYNPANPADPWRVFAADLPAEWEPIVNDLRMLEPRQAYWLRATKAISAPLIGGAHSARAAMAQSLTLPPATYYGLAPGAPPDGPVTITAWVGGQRCGETEARTARLGGQERLAFVIDVRAAGQGADRGCGTAGAPVRLVATRGGRIVAERRVAWNNDRVHPLGELGPPAVYLPLLQR